MANEKISSLTPGSAIAATDIIPAVETPGTGPVTKTGTQVGDWVLNGNYLANLVANSTGLYHTGVVNAGSFSSAGSNALALGTASVHANGYTYLPNQLLMQWGQLAVNSSTAAQTWPTAFSTNAYSVTAMPLNAAPGAVNAVVSTCNSTMFTVRTAIAGNTNVMWTAIGQ